MKLTGEVPLDVVEGVYWGRAQGREEWEIIGIICWDGDFVGFTIGTEEEIEMHEISELYGPIDEPPKFVEASLKVNAHR